MMEGILSQRVTPLLKCVVLFLFIFTAKVLTSRPQEVQDGTNEIHQLKPSHYVRTFTKYHHRRTIQWNNIPDYWALQDQPKVIQKRSIEDPNSSEFVNNDMNIDDFVSDSLRDNVLSLKKAIGSGKENQSTKNGLSNDVKTYKGKEVSITEAPKGTKSPSISCVYKINNVAIGVTPSYEDERNAQLMVENENFETGPISETTLPTGETVQVEQCTDSRAYCYTLWRQDNGDNVTVLGQGCWGGARGSVCDRCRPVTPRLPATKFCCCTTAHCNAYYLTIQDETVTMKAESTVNTAEHPTHALLFFTLVLMVIALSTIVTVIFVYKRRGLPEDLSDDDDVEKGDVMGSGPDALATGLLCVDNLTLIEHIGQGKFGSVWRGALGSAPVAVKLYSSAAACQKEAAVYALPHLAHPNLLRYYGSDSRSPLTPGPGRSHLVVLELCAGTLRSRLQSAPLAWGEFATLAHGLASALAHLHTPTGGKPCVVHRDVNSGNVLVVGGRARLADLGLAQLLPAQRPHPPAPTHITEAGTLRYLSPEALEGALDLSEARAALCAVDVFALALVLWEMLWRCQGAHQGPTPPYAPPYHHHGLPARPTLAQMQSLVSRNKARPPLPAGPVAEGRALRLAADTCDDCWDHDAEARLTAVCVEERMAELRLMLQSHGPLIHDNKLHPHNADANVSPPESDKNSNCTAQNCDVTTPLLYPHPHIGRNACIERNTHTNSHTHTVELIHKSLKDITAPSDAPRVQNIEENCLSVARTNHRPIVQDFENSDRLNEVRSYQRPLEYVPNDVTSHEERRPKQTNLLHDVKVEKPKWGIRKFFERKFGKVETEVKLVPEHSNNSVQNGRTKTWVVNDKPINVNFDRPSNLVINNRPYDFEVPCTLSPPNRTLSPTMMIESDMNRENRVFNFKELPRDDNEPRTQNQIFAVIVPKSKPTDYSNLIEMRRRGSSESIKNSVRTSVSSQSLFKSAHSESEDSTVKKRLSCDNRITNTNSGSSSRASINLELQYIENNQSENFNDKDSPFDLNSECSSSEDEHLMLLSENGGSKITMQTIPKTEDKKKYQNEVLKEASHKTELAFNKFQNKYTNFDNEYSDPNDKENLMNGYSGDNPVYLAALKGEIDTADLKIMQDKGPKSPKPSLKSLAIKRQHSLEQVNDIFSSAGDINLQNPAGRVKTPGDLPVAIRKARRDRALQKGRASECNRLSLYDDRMMFGNSL